jgi:hypothetical protein
MGTKVEGKTYIPGYFDMADSSVNSNGNALPYYKENKLNVHLSDKFTITSPNGSVHYDKEMLKRTMLVHEATFRKQVYFDEAILLLIYTEQGIPCSILALALFSYSGPKL